MSLIKKRIILLKMIFKKLNLRIIFLILSVFKMRKKNLIIFGSVLQKKIICTITFSHYLALTELLFMSLEILPLEKIFYQVDDV